MAYDQPVEVMAFHSCDKELAMRLLNGSEELRPSNNPWDWLGPGVYFWEQNPHRALVYAEEAARQKQKFGGVIKTPFVIGAFVELGNCLNLVESNSIGIVKTAYSWLFQGMNATEERMPINKGANRQLDCAVIKYLHEVNRQIELPAFDSIRSPFHEGDPLYVGSNFTERFHIEICVRNPEMIKGYFLPRPVDKFNPYLRRSFAA